MGYKDKKQEQINVYTRERAISKTKKGPKDGKEEERAKTHHVTWLLAEILTERSEQVLKRKGAWGQL